MLCEGKEEKRGKEYVRAGEEKEKKRLAPDSLRLHQGRNPPVRRGKRKCSPLPSPAEGRPHPGSRNAGDYLRLERCTAAVDLVL